MSIYSSVLIQQKEKERKRKKKKKRWGGKSDSTLLQKIMLIGGKKRMEWKNLSLVQMPPHKRESLGSTGEAARHN